MCGALVAILFLVMLSVSHAADEKAPAYATPEEAAQDPDFAVQGEYTADGVGVQVVALGKGQFRVVTYKGGLPGDGWDSSSPKVEEKDTAATKTALEDGGLAKVERKSATLDAQPPEGAVVLFNGTLESVRKNWGVRAGGTTRTC